MGAPRGARGVAVGHPQRRLLAGGDALHDACRSSALLHGGRRQLGEDGRRTNDDDGRAKPVSARCPEVTRGPARPSDVEGPGRTPRAGRGFRLGASGDRGRDGVPEDAPGAAAGAIGTDCGSCVDRRRCDHGAHPAGDPIGFGRSHKRSSGPDQERPDPGWDRRDERAGVRSPGRWAGRRPGERESSGAGTGAHARPSCVPAGDRIAHGSSGHRVDDPPVRLTSASDVDDGTQAVRSGRGLPDHPPAGVPPGAGYGRDARLQGRGRNQSRRRARERLYRRRHRDLFGHARRGVGGLPGGARSHDPVRRRPRRSAGRSGA